MKKTILVSALLLEIGSMAQAETIDVDDNCTFQNALESANTNVVVGGCVAGSGDDVINLPEGVLMEWLIIAY